MRFHTVAGFWNTYLEMMYEGADENGDNLLDWEEIRHFQERLERDYRYVENETALRPDRFVAAGGGDCEDWALATAGLLRWWGWEPYVGSLAPSADAAGHAVCLFRVDKVPRGFTYWGITAGIPGSTVVPEGKYVPIDYEYVGALSNAVGKGWKLRSLWVPETLYGDVM